ncbi:hypothetical protein OSB04_006551 [Centaurea solstitialis]|uniref:Integrase catalytic domain-containing protein n=1 Tax=Centaurea solstitialis TaxID=347529 RepID=A0AA38TVY4_9ASTR|nr:hypothetical protein OSB04_006551 [Centaurea solstitialis]
MDCLKIDDKDICLVDSGSTHTVLKKMRYFSHLTTQKANISTISGVVNIIEGFGKAHVLLPGGTNLKIENALYSPKSQRNLLNFKDIRKNGYHIETMDEGESEYLLITNISSGKKNVLEKLSMYSSGLYYTKISAIETNMVINQKFMDRENFILWHDRLGHPGSVMMRKIIEQSCGYPLENQKILQTKDMTCVACSKGKLITRPSPAKVGFETLNFLERIQGDICGPIHPPCGPFRYFMVLIDASTKWSHVCLLSSRNLAFAAHFPDYPIKAIRLDNAGEFTSQIFNDYCMSIGIKVEHPVAHVHTQNGLAESLIKRLQMIARPMIMKSKLLVSAWGHVILHATTLIRIRPTSYNASSPLKTVFGQEPNISHLRIFGCAVYVPIAPPQRTKMGPQRRLRIYLQGLANQLPDTFTDPKRVTKSHVPAANAPIKIDVPEGQDNMSNESRARQKRGRPLGSNDKNPRKKKGANNQDGHIEVNETPRESPEETLDMMVPEEPQVLENEEISINYSMSRKVWNRDKTDVDDMFAYNVALNVMENEEDQEPKSVDECMHRKDWPK